MPTAMGSGTPATRDRVPLRLAVWNCNMRLHDKLEGIRRLAPDVLVVPECACPEVLLRRVPGLTPASMVWSGRSPHKGLAVMSFGAWNVATADEHDARGLTTIAAAVRGPFAFRLAAVWALPGAVEPVPRALDRLGSFLSAGPSAVATFLPGQWHQRVDAVRPRVLAKPQRHHPRLPRHTRILAPGSDAARGEETRTTSPTIRSALSTRPRGPSTTPGHAAVTPSD